MEYICKHCNKGYKSQQSRSNHYRIYHILESKSKVTLNLCEIKNFTCRYCDKMYKYKQGKYKNDTL